MTKARDLADLGGVTTRLDQVGNSDGALSNRNLLINSEFRVNQRGVTSLTGNSGVSAFLADRWLTYCNAVNWSASIQEVTLPDGTVTNSLKTVATTTSANAFFHPIQRVEALGKDYLQGKKVVLSAWVRTNVAGQSMRICDTINCHYIGTEIPSDGDWHKVYAVHTMPTNMNTGVTNAIQFHPIFTPVTLATNDYCEFALPQMELGSEPTPFEHRSFGDELAKCQRYYYLKGSGTGFGSAQSGAGAYARMYALPERHPVEMRATPTVSFISGGSTYFASGGGLTVGTPTGDIGTIQNSVHSLHSLNSSTTGINRLSIGNGFSFTRGQSYVVTSNFIQVDAEL